MPQRLPWPKLVSFLELFLSVPETGGQAPSRPTPHRVLTHLPTESYLTYLFPDHGK